MHPENQVTIQSHVEIDAAKANAVPGIRRHADGITTGMDRRGIGEIVSTPTPVLESIYQMVVVDGQIRLTKDHGGREQKNQEADAKNCAHNYRVCRGVPVVI